MKENRGEDMFFFNIIYNFLLIFAGIILFPFIILALAIVPKFRAGFWTKMGFYKNLNIDKEKETLFFHAVSVGEVNAIEALLKKTRETFPDKNIVLSTTTKTGNEIALKKLSSTVDAITYFPFDFFFSVLSFLNAVKPSKIIIAETEIWPGFVYLAKRQNQSVIALVERISAEEAPA